jgi:hypothetical protein
MLPRHIKCQRTQHRGPTSLLQARSRLGQIVPLHEYQLMLVGRTPFSLLHGVTWTRLGVPQAGSYFGVARSYIGWPDGSHWTASYFGLVPPRSP